MLNLKRLSKKIQKGFTIVEIAVVIAVIGLLAAITVVGYSSMQTSAEVARLQGEFERIKNGISVYEAKNGTFPRCATNPVRNECNMADLVDNLTVTGLPTTNPDGTPIIYVVAGSGYDSWGVRMKNMQSGTSCKQGFKVVASWWGSGTPACW